MDGSVGSMSSIIAYDATQKSCSQMESQIKEMQQKIDSLTQENRELKAWKQEYRSAKQSVCRMSVRLRKLCKRLTADNETLLEMQKIADTIRELIKSNLS
jgi:wobble nucleotide-excising tRNase